MKNKITNKYKLLIIEGYALKEDGELYESILCIGKKHQHL